MLIRREKGLCYTCDEKFSPNHRCANKQYMLIDCEEGGDELLEECPTPTAVENIEEQPSIHHLSLHAFQGQQGKATIRFVGNILGIEVQILLDGGSSDCSIHPRIAKHLQLPIEPASQVRVMIGDGYSMQGEGVIRELPVQIQGYIITFPAFVLPIAGSDVVMGASWLATLGPHVADYTINQAKLKFYYKGAFITLLGQNRPAVERAEFHQLQRLLHVDGVDQLFFLQYDL